MLAIETLNTINNLKEYKIKSMVYEGMDKDGQVFLKSESGVEFNLIRWIDHKHKLTLQYLTYYEIKTIISDFIAAKTKEELVTISKHLLIKRKYIDMKDTLGEPTFSFDLKDIKPSSQAGTKFYQLTINLKERVDK